MAPEQVMGERITAAVDIFAWGSVMVFAATGISPFGQDTIPAVINRILNQEPDLSRMPDELRDLVRECLAKDPAHRPTARDLLMRLLGQEGGAPPSPAATLPVAGPGAGETRLETIPGADDDVPTAVLGQGAVLAGGHDDLGQTAWGNRAGDQMTLPPVAGYPPPPGRSGGGGGKAAVIAAAVAVLVLAVVIGVTAWMTTSSDPNKGGQSPGPGVGDVSTQTATDTPSDQPSQIRPSQRTTTPQQRPITSQPPPVSPTASPTLSHSPPPVPPSDPPPPTADPGGGSPIPGAGNPGGGTGAPAAAGG
jgi:hypothetical protein